MSASVPPTLLCPNCHTKVTPADVFCGNCGHQLKATDGVTAMRRTPEFTQAPAPAIAPDAVGAAHPIPQLHSVPATPSSLGAAIPATQAPLAPAANPAPAHETAPSAPATTPPITGPITVPGNPHHNGLATASLVLGLTALAMALLMFFIGLFIFIAPILAVLGIIFGIISLKSQHRGRAIGGLVVSSIVLVTIIGIVVLVASFVGQCSGSPTSQAVAEFCDGYNTAKSRSAQPSSSFAAKMPYFLRVVGP